MNENMENVLIETPLDIKSEVKKVLTTIKKNQLETYTKTLSPAIDNVLTG